MNPIDERLRVEAEGHLAMDLAKAAGDRVFDLIRMHASNLPTVAAAISFGLLVAKQVYGETLLFAVNSMDGDAKDTAQVLAAAKPLARELLDIADRELGDELLDRGLVAGT